MSQFIFLTATIIFISGCVNKSVDTSDPKKAYRYWAGEYPSENVRVLEGKYLRSPHWTNEFEVFLHLEADEDWKYKFIKQNNLLQISQRFEFPKNTPDWYKPGESAVLSTPNGAYTGPFYFEDSVSNDIYIYQIKF